MKYNVQVAP